MRLGVYTDYVYLREGESVYAERAFAMFLARLRESLDGMVIAGRLRPEPGRSHYRLPEAIEFAPLGWYASQARPLGMARAALGSLRTFWRVLDRVDAVWLLGPHGLALPFAAAAALRRRRIVLGIRQELPPYVRSRHPGRRWVHAAALLLDAAFRLLARRCLTIVVGPALARRYRRAPRLLAIAVSLVSEADIARAADDRRSYDGELTVLSVGRLEEEKNPLLLADVLARLWARERRWRLVVCGEGPLEAPLRERLEALGVAGQAELRGYVPLDGLLEVYRGAHAFLHVSWTEGLPQVLFEAFAARLPVVATDVGGVSEAVGDGALLVPPGDAAAAATELLRLASDESLRRRLVGAGLERVRRHTVEAEVGRVLEFIRG